jgi:predicted  nucleic acid-binding Zn-ribbon protein
VVERNYSHPKWRQLAAELKQSRGNKCEKCASSKQLEVHHKTYIQFREVWDYPKELLQVLCFRCHKKEHKRAFKICNYRDCSSDIESRYEYCFQHYIQIQKENKKAAENKLRELKIDKEKEEKARKLAEQKLSESEHKNAELLKNLESTEKTTLLELEQAELDRWEAQEQVTKLKKQLEKKVASLKREQKKRVDAQNTLLKSQKKKEKTIDAQSAKIIEKAIDREVRQIEEKAKLAIEKALSDKEDSEQKILELSQKLESFDSRIITAQENLEDEKRAKTEEREKSQFLRQELDSLREKQSNTEAELQQAKILKEDSETELVRLREELEKNDSKSNDASRLDDVQSLEDDIKKAEERAENAIKEARSKEQEANGRISRLNGELSDYKSRISKLESKLNDSKHNWKKALDEERERSKHLSQKIDDLLIAIEQSDEERDRVIAIKEREDEMQRRHNINMLILSGFILLSIIGLGAILLNKEAPEIIQVGINETPAIEDQSKYSYLIKCPDEGCSGALRYIKEYNFFGCSNYKKDKTGCDETLKAPFRCSEHDTKFKTRVENDRGDIRYWVCDRFDICRLKFKYADIFSNHVICPTDGCRGILKLNSENPNYKFLGCPNWKDNGCSRIQFPLICPTHKKAMRLSEKKTHWICERYPKCREYYHYN